MRFWAVAATLLVASLAETAPAANVVNDRARLWPTPVIDFVVCDEVGTVRLGDRICKRQARWWQPRGRGPELADSEAMIVRDAVDRWNEQLGDNVRLRELQDAPEGPHIVFRAAARPSLCSTRGIGYSSRQRRKYISIGSRCNPGHSPEGTTSGAVLHEIMHAVGVYHEQQRFDRDALIQVDTDDRALRRFAEQWQPVCTPATQTCDQDGRNAVAVGPYDFASIMHYSVAGAHLTGAGWEHLISQGLEPDDIGQRNRLSATDIRAVELLYPERQRFAGLGGAARSSAGSAGAPALEP
jgi:hypothetical protein